MKKIFCMISLACLSLSAMAQSWVSQAKKAVFSVVTYDKSGNILNTGNGFYISEAGVAVSDYALFKNAAKAVVIDADGKKSDVSYILGANDMYDIVKYQVAVSGKVSPLKMEENKAAVGSTAYLLPYSTQKNNTPVKGSIKAVSSVADKYAFYTFSGVVNEKSVSSPLMNEAGRVIGIAQKGTDTEGYALSALYANELSISAFAASDYALNNIGIRKGLPQKEDEALVALMVAQTANAANYNEMLDGFIQQYPGSAEGYLRRAAYRVDHHDFDSAVKDLALYESKNSDKADVHFNLSKIYYQKSVYQSEPAYADWNLDKALTEIEAALALNKAPLYIKHKGDVLYAQANYAQAYDTYAGLLQTELRSAAIYYAMAQCKQHTGGTNNEMLALQDSAVNCYSKPYPNEAAPYLYALALTKANAGKYREAVTDYNEVEHIYGGRASAEFYYNRMLSEMKCRMYQQALDDIEEAAKLAPNDVDIATEQASMYVRVNDLDKGMTAARHLIALDATSSNGYRLLGYCLAVKKQKAEALQNLNKAKELGDVNADAIIKKYCK